MNESKQTAAAMTKSEREEMMKKIAEYEQEIEEKGDLQFEKSSSKMTQNNNWESSKQTDAPLTKADREEMMKKIAEYEYEDEDEEDEEDEDEDDEGIYHISRRLESKIKFLKKFLFLIHYSYRGRG